MFWGDTVQPTAPMEHTFPIQQVAFILPAVCYALWRGWGSKQRWLNQIMLPSRGLDSIDENKPGHTAGIGGWFLLMCYESLKG